MNAKATLKKGQITSKEKKMASHPLPPPPSAPAVDVIAKMPKVELHVHLDGAMRPSTLWALAKKRGMKVEFPDEESFRKACICREGATLPEFLEKFAIMCPIVAGSLEGKFFDKFFLSV